MTADDVAAALLTDRPSAARDIHNRLVGIRDDLDALAAQATLLANEIGILALATAL